MRLRHIEVIQAILETGSVTAAANLLHISQPAVSKVLQHAEQQVGFALFTRAKGRLVATREMTILRGEINGLSENLQRIRELAGNLRLQDCPPLRVICTPTLASSVLPTCMQQWRQRYPDKHCSLATQHTDNIQRALLLRDFDLGLSLQPSFHPAIRSTCLTEGSVKAIAPPGFWPSGTKTLALEQLAGLRLTGLDARDPIGMRLNALLENLQPPPQVCTRVQTYQLQLSMVASGEGIALVDPFTATLATQQGLEQATLAPQITVGLHAWWLDEQPLLHYHQHFLDVLRSTTSNIKDA
ncbi:LysR family transcriptional regulator [Pseudomonas sp. 8AS]|nr:LysR family transcriptional regulator [Pseudomonas sp. 8AS]